MQILTFAAEEPIEEYFCRVWVRRIFDHTDDAVAAADVSSFFERWQMFHRKICVQERIEIPIAHANGQSQAPFGQCIGDLTRVTTDKHFLLCKLANIFLALQV